MPPLPINSQIYTLINVITFNPDAPGKHFHPLLIAKQITLQQWGTPSFSFETCHRDWFLIIYAYDSSRFNYPPFHHSISDHMKTPQLWSLASTKWSQPGPVHPLSLEPCRRDVWSQGGMPATSRDGLFISLPFRYWAIRIYIMLQSH